MLNYVNTEVDVVYLLTMHQATSGVMLWKRKQRSDKGAAIRAESVPPLTAEEEVKLKAVQAEYSKGLVFGSRAAVATSQWKALVGSSGSGPL